MRKDKKKKDVANQYTRTMKFRLRVDEINDQVAPKFKDFLKTYPHVLVHHVLPHGNPHFHAYVDIADKNSCPAVRYTIDTLFGVSKTERSVKKCDDERVDDYVQYLFNEKHDNKWTLISHTFDVDLHVQKAKAVAAAFKTRITKSQVVSEWQMVEELRNAMENRLTEKQTRLEWHEIIEMAIVIREKHQKMWNDMTLARMCQVATINQPSFKNETISKVVSRLRFVNRD